MAISRPFLLALLGVALLGATIFAVSNARNNAGDIWRHLSAKIKGVSKEARDLPRVSIK